MLRLTEYQFQAPEFKPNLPWRTVLSLSCHLTSAHWTPAVCFFIYYTQISSFSEGKTQKSTKCTDLLPSVFQLQKQVICTFPFGMELPSRCRCVVMFIGNITETPWLITAQTPCIHSGPITPRGIGTDLISLTSTLQICPQIFYNMETLLHAPSPCQNDQFINSSIDYKKS